MSVKFYKNFFKKIFTCIAILAITICIIFVFNFFNDNKDNASNVLNSQNDNILKQELLNQKLKNSERLISKISSQTDIILLKEEGSYTITHDNNPNGNPKLDWLTSSEISITMEYISCISIPSSKILFEVQSDASIKVYFSKADISLYSTDISNIYTQDKRGLIGKRYTSNEIAALINVAKDDISAKVYNDINIETANLNLINYLNDLANSFGIKITFK